MKIEVLNLSGDEDEDDDDAADPRRVAREKTVTTRLAPVTYRENDESVEIEMEVATTDPGSIEVSFKGRTLAVKVEARSQKRTSKDGTDGGTDVRTETSTDVRTREVEIPTAIDPENSDAVLRGNVLHLVFARRRDDGFRMAPVRIPPRKG